MTRRLMAGISALFLAPTSAGAQPGPHEAWSQTIGNWQAECIGVDCRLTASGSGVTGPSVVVERGAGGTRIWLVLDDPPVNAGQRVHYRCDDGPEGGLSAGRQLEIDRLDRTRLEVVNDYLVDGLQVLFAECAQLGLRYQPASAAGQHDEGPWTRLTVSMTGYLALTDAMNAHLSGDEDSE
jgi:hypothetical protein